MDFQTSALILAWAAILVLALAMSGLLRQVQALSSSRASRQQIGPPIGATAPALRPDGDERWGTTTVVLFLDTSCEACGLTLQLAEELAPSASGRLRFLAVYPAGIDGARHRHVEAIDHAQEAFVRYQVPLTPFGVVVDGSGHVTAAAPLGSAGLLRELVDDTLARR